MLRVDLDLVAWREHETSDPKRHDSISRPPLTTAPLEASWRLRAAETDRTAKGSDVPLDSRRLRKRIDDLRHLTVRLGARGVMRPDAAPNRARPARSEGNRGRATVIAGAPEQ